MPKVEIEKTPARIAPQRNVAPFWCGLTTGTNQVETFLCTAYPADVDSGQP